MAALHEKSTELSLIRYTYTPAELQTFPKDSSKGIPCFEYCRQVIEDGSSSLYWDELVAQRKNMPTGSMVVKGCLYANNMLVWTNNPGIRHEVWSNKSVIDEEPKATIKTEVYRAHPKIRIAITRFSDFGGTPAHIAMIAEYLDNSISHGREHVVLDLWTGEKQEVPLPEYAALRRRS